ncbi:MAG: indole-3-glycerol-phosphate synthase [Candidatus Micrarchaeia archaeon]
MSSFLKRVIPRIGKLVESGFYDVRFPPKKKRSLAGAVEGAARGAIPLIAEIKPASPSAGRLFCGDARAAAGKMVAGGAVALSVLTEPRFFGGSAVLLKEDFGVPLLQKDFIASERQFLDGADAVLLIQALLDAVGADAEALIEKAHARGLEVMLEAHTLDEFRRAKKTRADLIGINNRSLASLRVDLRTTGRILRAEAKDRLVVSESGIRNRADALRMLRAGADAVLVGTSLLRAKDIEGKVRGIVWGRVGGKG